MNMRYGHKVLEMAKEAGANQKVQKYLAEEVKRLIRDLKNIKRRMIHVRCYQTISRQWYH